jgi:2-amino-4-hydroxy-6-hydroxymethyldihydropteridine diphosphokinase
MPGEDAYVGMGANLGDAPATLREALRLLGEQPEVTVVACSSAYASDPVGYVDQPPFVNAVAHLRTSLEPASTLALLLATEDRLGRVRGIRFGPRTCDLDLLLHGATASAEPELTLPHPRMHERRFVLEPLHELAPDAVLPDGRPVALLLAATASQGVRRLSGISLH